MRARLIARLILITLLSLAAGALAQALLPGAPETPDADAPVTELAPATAPASQPADSDGLLGVLLGEKSKFDPWDLTEPRYWVGFVQEIITWIIGFIPRAISALILLIIFWLIYRTVRKVVLSGMKAAGVDESIRDMLGMLLKWFILGFGLIIAGNQIGIQIAALLTGVSIIGLAIGFAAQESISNFIAGIMIFWDKPFKIGDWIEIYGQLGQVKRVTFRSTRLVNLDGDVVILPNIRMLQETVVNKSTNPVTRCNVPIGIAYKESIDKARQVLLSLVTGDPRIVKSPEPEVIVKSLGASSVDLMLHFWIVEEKYEDAMQYEYMERAKVALDEAGIEIPFPHLQLLLEKTPALEGLGRG